MKAKKIREGDIITVNEQGLTATGVVTLINDWGHYSDIYLGEDQTYYVEVDNSEDDQTISLVHRAPKKKKKKGNK